MSRRKRRKKHKNRRVPWRGFCLTGKRRYSRKYAAEIIDLHASDIFPRKPIRYYHCRHCGDYHCTSQEYDPWKNA